ncbi:hypothetical protein H257_19380 [Aphanomyces astaci]|uniref:Uncharacterized protein n=1 Tax=Aphanomyces astaci TaxID=112090 RepID=W4F9U8_APHAT|nr:hypothetical protein H257_19380 [Aphanomyces astaci]ETV63689.1 hypothetical protein H257_19380 [Aphanomyces astaci]|eukprot:XP_009846828.1 hypothetical protein H257_19380 [Aphanomyces astaci]
MTEHHGARARHAGVNISTEGTTENTQLPGSSITSGVGEAPPGARSSSLPPYFDSVWHRTSSELPPRSFEEGSTFYMMGSRPMLAPPPVYGKDGFKERDQQTYAKRFIMYARGQDAISVSSDVRIGTVSMSSCMTAEAHAHDA